MAALSRQLRDARLAAAYSGTQESVFATANGTAVSARNAARQMAKTVDAANLDGVTFHTLRHTFASTLIAQGRDAAFVADQLGHDDPAFMWRTHIHLFRAAEHAKTARDKLNADFGGLLREAK